MSVEAGIDAIRAKGIALTEYAIALHDAWLAPLGFTLGSPRDAARRGSHVSVRRVDARELTRRMIAAGVAARLPGAGLDPARPVAADDELRRRGSRDGDPRRSRERRRLDPGGSGGRTCPAARPPGRERLSSDAVTTP